MGWHGDVGPSAASVPFCFAGKLHALKLKGFAPPVAAYPRCDVDDVDDRALWAAVTAAMAQEEVFLLDWLNSQPQTNELRRSAALLAVAAQIGAETDMPLSLIELGASAGLNLNFDRFSVTTPAGTVGSNYPILTLYPEWRGAPPRIEPFSISARTGCDLAPVDPQTSDGKLRLLVYL